ncbi:MAG: NifB/NifX family molybdenum-iron cluster-binding protein [Victivallales bacterium]|nr:NifB/NifX family molybdenum-iron cluster-binding protein [Victivallales bacterium]
MKVAIPVWQERVSPVFDASRSLRLISLDNEGREFERQMVDVQVVYSSQRVTLLMDLEADVLICGAISAPLASMIASTGIQLIPFVAGEVEAVLAAFRRGELPSPAYMMPGCSGYRRRYRRGCNWK